MVEISVDNVELKGIEKETIEKVVSKVLEEEKILHEVSVYVTLTNNEEIQKLNKEHRQVDSPTDVLSFPMYERGEVEYLKTEKTDDIEEMLGDIQEYFTKYRTPMFNGPGDLPYDKQSKVVAYFPDKTTPVVFCNRPIPDWVEEEVNRHRASLKIN